VGLLVLVRMCQIFIWRQELARSSSSSTATSTLAHLTHNPHAANDRRHKVHCLNHPEHLGVLQHEPTSHSSIVLRCSCDCPPIVHLSCVIRLHRAGAQEPQVGLGCRQPMRDLDSEAPRICSRMDLLDDILAPPCPKHPWPPECRKHA
jgi:hypothetical protein